MLLLTCPTNNQTAEEASIKPQQAVVTKIQKEAQCLPSSVWNAVLHAKMLVALATGNPLAAGLQGQLREKEVKLCLV